MAEQAGDPSGVEKAMLELAQLERTMGVVSKGIDILSDPGGYASGYTQGLGDLFQVGADLNIPIISPLLQGGSDFLSGVTSSLRGEGSSAIDQRVDQIFYPEYGMGDSFRSSGGSYADTQRRFGPPGR